MYEVLTLIGLSIWLGLPAWIANAIPVILGGGLPIDLGKDFIDGKRVLGNGKTTRGFVTGVLFGTLVGAAQSVVAPFLVAEVTQYVVVTPEMLSIFHLTIPISFLQSTGALTGDMIGSFVKRRVDVRSGNPAPVLDQLGFIIMALLFSSPLIWPGRQYVSILIIMTLVIHWITNITGYILGLKDKPW
ncbi:MAG: CDP-2,3-bis-(O-geranylgeranyl)-sn-glycerol synthase [Candidatus Thorarchaeota archaeon]|nr:CDP-2,3-bis-(O-geranylgeranyl)-sn-glycerol synthase [Candidatus Thorarchaeota archaeon]